MSSPRQNELQQTNASTNVSDTTPDTARPSNVGLFAFPQMPGHTSHLDSSALYAETPFEKFKECGKASAPNRIVYAKSTSTPIKKSR